MKQVVAYEAFGIFADYDGYAPDTESLALVSSEDLARQVCKELNIDPSAYTVACVDGYEHCKKFAYRRALTDSPSQVLSDFEGVLMALEGD